MPPQTMRQMRSEIVLFNGLTGSKFRATDASEFGCRANGLSAPDLAES